MSTNKHNEECCKNCASDMVSNGHPLCMSSTCPCHSATDEDIDKAVSLLPNPEDDGPNAAGNQIPTVSHGVISTDMVVTPKSKYDDPNFKSDFDKFVEEHPSTDVSWEPLFDEQFVKHAANPKETFMVLNTPDIPKLKSFIRKQIDLAREESKHITKSGRVMYMGGKREAFGQALKILEEELVLAHTTVSGKTSRLTSAFVRIEHLRDDSEALSNK